MNIFKKIYRWFGTYNSPVVDWTGLKWKDAQVYAKEGLKVAIFDWPKDEFVVWNKDVPCFCKFQGEIMEIGYKPSADEIGCVWTVRR